MSGRKKTGKTVIALHGAGMHGGAWNMLAQELSCTALSFPGHGDEKGALLTSIEDMADWVRTGIKAYPPHSVVLLGHSMGALVALEAARSQAVSTLVLMGAAAAMPVHPDLLKQARETPDTAAGLVLKWGVSRNHPQAVEILQSQMQPDTLANDLAACNAYAAGETTAKSFEKPVLVLAGPDDKLTKAAAGQALAEMMPRGRFRVIEGCGHMAMVENPIETAGEIEDFLAELTD